jgi:hypothetical protein
MLLMLLLGSLLMANDLKISKVGDWGSGEYTDAAIYGNHAFLLAPATGLDIMDISNPSFPTKVATYQPPLLSGSIPTSGVLHLQGSTAYIFLFDWGSQEGALSVLDIGSPTSPVLLGQLETYGRIYDIAVKAPYLYVANGQPGMHVFHIGNPASPVDVTTISPGGAVEGVALAGDYAFVVNGSRLVAIDISNPMIPYVESHLDIASYAAHRIRIQGNYAYVGSDDKGLWVFDISNPSALALLAEPNIPLIPLDLAVGDNYVYTCGYVYFHIIDISTPGSPVETARYQNDMTNRTLAISSNYAYLAGDNGAVVVDISNPASPFASGFYLDITEGLYDIVTRDYKAYAGMDRGISVLDIANPYYPKLIKTNTISGGMNSLCFGDTYLYAAANGGLYALDVSDPDNVTIVGSSGSRFDYAVGMALSGNYAYTTFQELRVFDISNPAAPNQVGMLEYKGPGKTAVQGNYAYIADPSKGVIIADISQPTSPRHITTYEMSGANDLFVDGNYLYLAANAGLVILDITVPALPTQAATFVTPGAAMGVEVQNNYAFVAEMGMGLQVVDIGNPVSPFSIFCYDLPTGAKTVHLDGNYIYVGGVDEKLYIFMMGSVPVMVTTPGSYMEQPMGTPLEISWEAGTYTGLVGVELFRYNVRVGQIAENLPASDGFYTWSVGTVNKGNIIVPGDGYRVGVRTVEGNYLDLGDVSFTITSSGVTLSLAGERFVESSWLISREVAKLDIRVQKTTGGIIVDKYLLERKEGISEYITAAEFTDSDLQNGSYTYIDLALKAEENYSYYVKAVNTDGSAIAYSHILTLETLQDEVSSLK